MSRNENTQDQDSREQQEINNTVDNIIYNIISNPVNPSALIGNSNTSNFQTIEQSNRNPFQSPLLRRRENENLLNYDEVQQSFRLTRRLIQNQLLRRQFSRRNLRSLPAISNNNESNYNLNTNTTRSNIEDDLIDLPLLRFLRTTSTSNNHPLSEINNHIPSQNISRTQTHQVNLNESSGTETFNLSLRREPPIFQSISEIDNRNSISDESSSNNSLMINNNLLDGLSFSIRNNNSQTRNDFLQRRRRLSLRSLFRRRYNREDEIIRDTRNNRDLIRLEEYDNGDLNENGNEENLDTMDNIYMNLYRNYNNDRKSTKNSTYIHSKHYFPFKDYPLKLNLLELDDDESPASIIYSCHGNFGLALYTCITLNKIDIKSNSYQPHKWIDAFFKYFFKVIEQSQKQLDYSIEGLSLSITNTNTNLYDIFEQLPSINSLEKIVNDKIYCNIDVYGIKLIIDLYENYYKLFNRNMFDSSKTDLYSIYRLAILFYNSLEENITIKLYEKIRAMKYKDHFFNRIIFSNYIITFKTRIEYIVYYKRKLKDLEKMMRGLEVYDFIK